MHLGNSIICPITAAPMLIVAGAATFYAFGQARKNFSKNNILPAILLTIFVFSLQMINFAIPFTGQESGSSGHIVGTMLLAILLGRNVAFLAMAAILLVQAVFFNDGGLMALGCNIFNMGFLACFVAYPFIYKPLADKNHKFIGAILSSTVALQLGAIAVVVESALSGSTISNAGLFASLMQSVHFGIGIIEGLFTALILALSKSRAFNISVGVISLILAGFISNYASSKPDGLEWSLLNMGDNFIAQTSGNIYAISESLQSHLAVLSTMPAIAANILGLAILSVLMFGICKSLAFEKAV